MCAALSDGNDNTRSKLNETSGQKLRKSGYCLVLYSSRYEYSSNARKNERKQKDTKFVHVLYLRIDVKNKKIPVI